jgi:6-phosphogluconolactonase
VPPEIVIEDVAALRRRLAGEFESRAGRAIASRGRVTVALSGGSVAAAFFPALAETAVDWSRTDFFWIDERAVPPDHPESNYALAARLWLTPSGVPEARIHRMHGEDPDLERAARLAAEELIEGAGDPPSLDLALVGVGEDGHVASIFPGLEHQQGRAEALRDRFVIPVYDSPKPPPRRLTLTVDVLSNVERIIVMALGSSKARAVSEALKGTTSETPVRELLRRARSPLLLLDRDAAAELAL